MKLTFDMHTHSTAAGHAYSTLWENIAAAQDAGLKYLGFSEHGPKMPGGPHPWFFGNFKAIPRQYGELRLFCGAEANIMDDKGGLDLNETYLQKMEYVIASMHLPCIAPGDESYNTRAAIMAIRNPYVKILGHPDDARYPLNREEVVLAAKQEGVIIEINEGSLDPLSTRGGRENILELLELCKKHQVEVILGSDSHFCATIGRFEKALQLMELTSFPEHLVINRDPANISKVIN